MICLPATLANTLVCVWRENELIRFLDWEEKFMEHLADLQVGVEELRNAAPQNDEERHNVFLLKKQIVDTLVHKATINKNREIIVLVRNRANTNSGALRNFALKLSLCGSRSLTTAKMKLFTLYLMITKIVKLWLIFA